MIILNVFAQFVLMRMFPESYDRYRLVLGEQIRQKRRAQFERSTEALSSKAAKPLSRVKPLIKLKLYAQAEAACREAYAILSPAPFMQQAAMDSLASVYAAEQRYREALDIWTPIYKRQGSSPALSTNIMVCLANLGLVNETMGVAKEWFRMESRSLEAFDVDDLPTSQEVTPENVKALALLLRAYDSGEDSEEKLADLKEAKAISPRNGNILFYLADTEDLVLKDAKQIAAYYWKAYQYCGPKLKGTVKLRLLQLGEKVL